MTDLFSNGNQWEVLGWTMLHFLWMGCIAFVISAGVRWCVRNYSAVVRYSAALLCLLGVTGAAGVALFVSIQQVDSAVRPAQAVSVPPELTSIETAAPLSVEWMRHGGLPQLPADQPQPVAGDLTASEAFRQWVLESSLNVFALLLPWLWVCGTPLVILLLFTGIIGTTRLRRRSTAVTDEQILRQMKHLGELLGISRRVGIAVCSQISSPMVIGILRPLIVLPPSIISGLAPAQLEMILMHELAHVRRWDNLVNLLQRTIEALLFYHPVVWWASRWVRLEREHCCDALVLSHNHTPQSYAETLATLALPELAPQFATAAMANHQLTSRICHILNVEERTMSISIRTVVGGIVLLAAGAGGFLLATLRPGLVAADDPPAQEALDLIAQEEPAATDRLMFGVGVNSDAGVIGQVVFEDESEALLRFDANRGRVVGESLETWGRRGWSANEATGPPDVREAGDNEQAWASQTEDGQKEWLRLTYDEPVPAAAAIVHESFNPGALTKVTTTDSEGAEVVLWEGEDPVSIENGKGVALIVITQAPELSEVTLHLDSPAVAGWNEIDAVGLIDRFTGEVHWATSAEASSSFADLATLSHEGFHDAHHFAGSNESCLRCHSGHTDSMTRQQRIQQLRAELKLLEAELVRDEALRAAAELEEQQRFAEAEHVERQAIEAWRAAGGTLELDDKMLRSPQHELGEAERQALEAWIAAGAQFQESEQGDADSADAPGGLQQPDRAALLEMLQWLNQYQLQQPAEGDPDSAGLLNRLETYQQQLLLQQQAAEAEPDSAAARGAWQGWWQRGFLPQQGQSETDSAAAPDSLEELRQTLQLQQQAIEALTNTLEELRQRIESRGDSGGNESDADGEGVSIQVPGMGEAPLALDFAFPLESSNVIDDFLQERWRRFGIEDSGEITDEQFIRRIYLDLLGRPPTVEELKQFLENESPTSREELLESLLQSENATDNWNEAFSFYLEIER